MGNDVAVIVVQSAALDVGALLGGLGAGRCDVGGIGSFLGLVREESGGRRLASMTLEHYPGMTERALDGIAAEAERRWSLLGCVIAHRIGRMVPGEAIVLVGAAASHRAAALAATAFLIDFLKTKAPFWKLEEWTDGARAWVEAREADEVATGRWGQGSDDGGQAAGISGHVSDP